MAGGLMQLVAYGAQDVYLTGNPKVTFFQAVYKRHTNFAMENIEQTVNGNVTNSGRVSVTVARNGDLIGDMYLEMSTVATLVPTANNVSTDSCWAAERAISAIELTIGGQRIDKHYQRWWRLYSELYLTEDQKNKWARMSTNPLSGTAGKVFLPLIFFFNRNAGLYLPLIALQYHEVRIDIDLSSDLSTYISTATGFKVWGNYVYLDTEERRRFAQKGHEYLIEQVQHTGTDTVTAGSAKQIRLSYNHPVKELVWAVGGASAANNYLWNFTSNTNGPEGVVLTCNPYVHSNLAPASANLLSVCSLSSGVGVPQVVFGKINTTPGVSVSTTAWHEDGTPDNFKSVGPVDTFKLILNGQDRFKEQPGKYFNQMQAFNHHSGNPMPGIYSYSFALKPEEHQPTGTCNFSRIDNAQVEIKAKSGIASAATTLYMFAVNYNVLRIQSGMGGLAFSN
jgi:hypothetical protein